MFPSIQKPLAPRDSVSRRRLLKAGIVGTAQLQLAAMWARPAPAADSTAINRDHAIIFVELAGGQSQFESYDPKPHAPQEYRGAFGVTQTNLPGVVFSELMPEQARIADKLTIVRSISHENNNHGASSHLSQTGYYMAGDKEGPNEMPCFGSVVSRICESDEDTFLPYVAVPEVMRYGRAAYLGPSCNPFEIHADPNQLEFTIPDLTLLSSIPSPRFSDRNQLRAQLDTLHALPDLSGSSEAMDKLSQTAFNLIHNPRARAAFDLSRESDALRDRYGRNTLGQSMLLARRLVESGVLCVSVRSTGWDDHAKLPDGVKQRTPAYDRGMAALVTDLYDRGLERNVLVVAMGEFGRTPRINRDAGRDHWGAVMSVVLAGGGLQPGVLGTSNAKGEYPVQSPYRPENVLAMMYRHLGIDPAMTFLDHVGRPRYLLEERGLIEELL